MQDSWLELIDRVLRPARPQREQCLRERDRHQAATELVADERARAIKSCEARIEAARKAVFQANDGVIPSLMTELEREWRKISRSDPDQGLMDLWARIAPPAWIDRKLWRDSDSTAKLDAAVALASDVDGVEAAESAIAALRGALAAWGTPIGQRIRWRAFERDVDCVSVWLATPERAARESVAAHYAEHVIFERAQQLEQSVRTAALTRLPGRPALAEALARAAIVDYTLRASALDLPNPVTPLRALWKTGYALSALDASGVTLEIPEL